MYFLFDQSDILVLYFYFPGVSAWTVVSCNWVRGFSAPRFHLNLFSFLRNRNFLELCVSL